MVLLQCIVKVSKPLVVEYGVCVCVCVCVCVGVGVVGVCGCVIKWYYTLICVLV